LRAPGCYVNLKTEGKEFRRCFQEASGQWRLGVFVFAFGFRLAAFSCICICVQLAACSLQPFFFSCNFTPVLIVTHTEVKIQIK
jgi:hypothetical protein